MPEQMSEEQMKALQEKIKNMSPEELKEYQKKQCIFCQIISGKVQSKKIFEDDKTIGILDINPGNPGHILLLPKEHYTIMPQMPESEIGHIFMVAKALSNALLKSIGAHGTNMIVANGVAAGQRAQHFMVHIIPRMEKDDIQFTLPQNTIPENELDEIHKKLSQSLGLLEKKKSEAPPMFKKPEKKVVKAEFEEKKEDNGHEMSDKKEKKRTRKKKEKVKKQKSEAEEKELHEEQKKDDKEEPEENDDEDINLDDIAGVLGAK